jgi:hypothetical protein
MFYIILAAIVAFALFIILRDSSDGAAYNKKGESGRSAAILPSEQVKPAKAKAAATNAERGLSWTYLYYLDYSADLRADLMETEVTGMRYYCSLADVGLINGTVRPEPENPHDPRAQVVIRADGKKLGYIPRTALPRYEEFNQRNLVCPFAGRVSVDRQGYMKADILVALPVNRDWVKKQLSDYMESR